MQQAVGPVNAPGEVAHFRADEAVGERVDAAAGDRHDALRLDRHVEAAAVGTVERADRMNFRHAADLSTPPEGLYGEWLSAPRRLCRRGGGFETQLPGQERPGVGRLVDLLRQRLADAVAGFDLGAQEDRQ